VQLHYSPHKCSINWNSACSGCTCVFSYSLFLHCQILLQKDKFVDSLCSMARPACRNNVSCSFFTGLQMLQGHMLSCKFCNTRIAALICLPPCQGIGIHTNAVCWHPPQWFCSSAQKGSPYSSAIADEEMMMILSAVLWMTQPALPHCTDPERKKHT